MNLESILDWLTALPTGALLSAMLGLAIAENFFPPIPADTLVAFGSFLAARQGISPVPAFLCVFLGNTGGAVAMYLLGRKFGAAWVRRRLHLHGDGAEKRIRDWYDRFGLPALFLSRFVPGVRAVAPPLAGALHVPLFGAASMIAIASAVWYGVIAFLAYRVGENWDAVAKMIGRFGRVSGIVAGVIIAILVGIWLLRRRAGRRK